MKKLMKKVLSICLIGGLVLSDIPIQANAETIGNETSEIVYVDGNAIKVTVDPISEIITAESVDKKDDTCLVISEQFGSMATIYDETEQEYIDYDIDVEDLSYEDVDITVYDEEGEIVEDYDDIDDLLDDEYDGQAATATVVTTISVSSLITALLEVAACIAVAGVIYYGAKAAVKAITKKGKKKQYFKAYIYDFNVFINISNAISRNSAINRIKTKRNVYTYSSSRAKSIVKATGLGCTPKEISDLKGKIRFYHYHTAKRNGAHAFFGKPVTY